MVKNRLEMLEREFGLFRLRVNELERLKGILYSLDTWGFEKDFAVIKENLSNVENIAEIERLIYNLKLRVREKRVKSASKITELIDRIFECNGNIDKWSHEKIRKGYDYIFKKYMEFSEEEKMIVYNILIGLYNKIKKKNG